METAKETCPCSTGCGCPPNITISVTPTTGGQFELAVTKNETIENLKKQISKRLKVPKERICLLHRERQLRDGTIQENQLVNGSRLTLLPSVETGLLAQRPEQSVMQALESLNDSQVNDFLSGKAPLNLTMRLGDHMMLIQLQLSTVAPAGKKSRSSAGSSSSSSRPSATAVSNHPSSSSSSNNSTSSTPSSNSTSSSNSSSPSSVVQHQQQPTTTTGVTMAAPSSSSSTEDCACEPRPVLDTKALAEASRNLTQTLKQLSSEVLHTPKTASVEEVSSLKRRQGAIIESMHHHGKGVYSGTFSGTLNPALQDRFGRPKRDISTIIHILNDLLCATPQYRAASSSSSSSGGSSSAAAAAGLAGSSSSTTTGAGGGSSTAGAAGGGGPGGTTSTELPSKSQTTLASTSSSPRPSSSCSETTPVTEGSKAGLGGGLTTAESDENRATRGKMERLRLVLGQRRERRRAMRSQPYPTTAGGRDHVTA